MTVYNMNLTDPLHPVSTFVVNPYTANGVRFPTSSLLEPGASSSRTSLLWYGKGSPNYGERIQENIIHLLENFAGASEPVRSLAGQLWFQRHLFFHGSATPALGWFVWEDNAAGSPVAGQWVSISPVTVTGTEPVINSGGAANQYYLNNSTTPAVLYQGINVPGHPLNNQWIARSYMEDVTIPDPNVPGIMPHQQMMVQTLGRNGSTDPTNWISVGNPIASQIAPNTDTPGTLWYDTSELSLKVYDGSTFEAVVGDYVLRSGDTMTGTLQLPASNTGPHTAASLRIPHGFAPGTPADGDIWTTTFGVYAQIDGVTVQLNSISGFLDDLGDVTIAAPQDRQVLLFDGSGSPPTNEWINTDLVFSDISDSAITVSELNSLTGITLNVQDQLDDKLDLTTGGTMLVALDMGGNLIQNVANPVDPQDAATRGWVLASDRFANGGSLNPTDGTLTITMAGGAPAVNVGGFLDLRFPYVAEPDELISILPQQPDTLVNAVHDLDKIVKRRTTNTRLVVTGTAATTYTVPTYEVGSNKLFVFVDGLKRIASTQGSQRVSYFLNPTGSPEDITVTVQQLDCTVAIGDPNFPIVGSPTTQYGFDVEVDGGLAQTITIDPTIIDEEYTFCSLVADINAQLVGAFAVLEDSGIVIYSDTHGTGSSIVITDGGIGSPAPLLPLFATTENFFGIDAAISGVTYGYNEIGEFGTLSDSIEFNASVDTTTIEFIVAGQSGIPI